VACWIADTGQLIGVAPADLAHEFAASSHSIRVIVSDYREFPVSLTDVKPEIFKELFVWDFATSRKVVSWRSEFRHPFAISPDGQYVAEGGKGLVRVYKIGSEANSRESNKINPW